MSRGFILSSTDHKRQRGAQTSCVKRILTVYTGISLANNAHMSTFRLPQDQQSIVCARCRRVPEHRNTHDQTNITAGGYSSKTPVTNLLGTRYEFESVQAVRTTLHHTQKLICLNGKPPPPSIGGVVQLPSKVPLYGCTRISCVTKRILGAYETMDKSATIMTALAGEEDSITRTFPTALHHYASSRGHL